MWMLILPGSEKRLAAMGIISEGSRDTGTALRIKPDKKVNRDEGFSAHF